MTEGLLLFNVMVLTEALVAKNTKVTKSLLFMTGRLCLYHQSKTSP